MSNVASIRPTHRAKISVHQVTFDLVPRAIVEKLFHAAIAVGWAADDEAYSTVEPDARDRLEALKKAVGLASQFTVLVDREVDEPISLMGEAS